MSSSSRGRGWPRLTTHAPRLTVRISFSREWAVVCVGAGGEVAAAGVVARALVLRPGPGTPLHAARHHHHGCCVIATTLVMGHKSLVTWAARRLASAPARNSKSPACTSSLSKEGLSSLLSPHRPMDHCTVYVYSSSPLPYEPLVKLM